MKNAKIVLVGDSMCGRTALLARFINPEGGLLAQTDTTVGEEKSCTWKENFNITFTDTPGVDDYDRLRPLHYKIHDQNDNVVGNADAVMLCFTVDRKSSYQRILWKWVGELKEHLPNVPIILVGTRSDTRNNNLPNPNLIPKEKGETLAKYIGATKYIECSALTGEGVVEAFETAMNIAVEPYLTADALTRGAARGFAETMDIPNDVGAVLSAVKDYLTGQPILDNKTGKALSCVDQLTAQRAKEEIHKHKGVHLL
ncbi:MAG: rhob [Rickettsiales bacterium]|jgi:small GTP-binding protein|nr:rhob [Rickettsiales bacterium]